VSWGPKGDDGGPARWLAGRLRIGRGPLGAAGGRNQGKDRRRRWPEGGQTPPRRCGALPCAKQAARPGRTKKTVQTRNISPLPRMHSEARPKPGAKTPAGPDLWLQVPCGGEGGSDLRQHKAVLAPLPMWSRGLQFIHSSAPMAQGEGFSRGISLSNGRPGHRGQSRNEMRGGPS